MEMNCQENRNKSFLPRLPPEIWEEVFNYVTNPTDLLSAMNSNAEKSEWKEILNGRKSELFSLVLQVPNFMASLPFSTILSCRQLNHSYKAIIDSTLFTCRQACLEENEGKLSKSKKYLKKTIRKIENSYIFSNRSEIKSFLVKIGNNFDRHPNFNPFILGTIEFNLINPTSSLNSTFLVNFLEIFGKFVISLKIRFGRSFCAQVGILLSVLEQVENLEELEIETMPGSYFFISWPFHFEEIYEWIERIELGELRRLNVGNCRTCIGMGEPEYWDDWGKWKDLPRTVEGALVKKFEKQLKNCKK